MEEIICEFVCLSWIFFTLYHKLWGVISWEVSNRGVLCVSRESFVCGGNFMCHRKPCACQKNVVSREFRVCQRNPVVSRKSCVCPKFCSVKKKFMRQRNHVVSKNLCGCQMNK